MDSKDKKENNESLLKQNLNEFSNNVFIGIPEINDISSNKT